DPGADLRPGQLGDSLARALEGQGGLRLGASDRAREDESEREQALRRRSHGIRDRPYGVIHPCSTKNFLSVLVISSDVCLASPSTPCERSVAIATPPITIALVAGGRAAALTPALGPTAAVAG